MPSSLHAADLAMPCEPRIKLLQAHGRSPPPRAVHQVQANVAPNRTKSPNVK